MVLNDAADIVAYNFSFQPINSQPVDGMPSKEELYQMVGSKEYKDNPAYRNKVERMFQQVFG